MSAVTELETAEPPRLGLDDVRGRDRGDLWLRKLEILRAIAEHGAMSTEDIAATTGRPLSSTHRYLAALHKSGYLRRAKRPHTSGGPHFAGYNFDLGQRAWELLTSLQSRQPRRPRLAALEAVLREELPRADPAALHTLAGRLLDALSENNDAPTEDA